MTASYRFGIEEEYFLADATTRGTPPPPWPGSMPPCATACRRPSASCCKARWKSPRPLPPISPRRVACCPACAVAWRISGGSMACWCWPPAPTLAQWSSQDHTEAERYEGLMRDLRMLGRRNVVCGMHVHVEVPRPEARIDLMNRLMPFMPLLLGLSASSPFWQGQETGLAAYRLSVFGEMPRTGLPDLFHDAEDYARYVEIMTRAGAIKDASFLWWTLRPSIKFPTLELRVADACTRLEDTIAIAALYRCLVRCADRRPELNRGMTGTSRALVAENLWRAQRDGARAMLIDEAKGRRCPSPMRWTPCWPWWRRMPRRWAAPRTSAPCAASPAKAPAPTGRRRSSPGHARAVPASGKRWGRWWTGWRGRRGGRRSGNEFPNPFFFLQVSGLA
ncbi:YbdK family carboxylate-amine ligase [Pseudoroseomonas wenyumeiae]